MSHINKEDFISLVKENIKREGIDNLIKYLEGTDFFEAPASSMYHSDYDGGLIDHSYNVFKLLSESDKLDHNIYSMESIAIVSLFHDVCKANFYVKGERNVKSEEGKWVKVPYYKIDEAFPLGHGEKSVYIVGKYLDLTDDEALAINWHMGSFDNRCKGGDRSLSKVFQKSLLALELHIADMRAAYILENF